MTPEEVVELFRLDIDDTDADDPLWSTLEVYSYLDEAQKEFARKTDYFSDASTVAITQVSVTADDPWVSIDPRVTKIRAARLSSTGSKIWPVTFAQMEDQPNTVDTYGSPFNFGNNYNWMTAQGTPRFMVMDMEKDKARLASIPVADDTIELQVYRLPLNDITEDSVSLEVTETDYQRKLIPYMKYLAYSKNDVDTFEQDLADRAKAEAYLIYDEVKTQLRRQRIGCATRCVSVTTKRSRHRASGSPRSSGTRLSPWKERFAGTGTPQRSRTVGMKST